MVKQCLITIDELAKNWVAVLSLWCLHTLWTIRLWWCWWQLHFPQRALFLLQHFDPLLILSRVINIKSFNMSSTHLRLVLTTINHNTTLRKRWFWYFYESCVVASHRLLTFCHWIIFALVSGNFILILTAVNWYKWHLSFFLFFLLHFFNSVLRHTSGRCQNLWRHFLFKIRLMFKLFNLHSNLLYFYFCSLFVFCREKIPLPTLFFILFFNEFFKRRHQWFLIASFSQNL